MAFEKITCQQVLEALLLVRRYVMEFNSLLEWKYNLTDNPIHHVGKNGIVPKKGVLEVDSKMIYYVYHGAGCSVDYNGVQLEFDLLPDESTMKFGAWELQQFMLSHFKLDERDLDTDKIAKCLLNFAETGEIRKNKYSNAGFEIDL